MGARVTKKARSPRQYGAKWTPEVQEKFLDGLRNGLTPKQSAERLGMARATAFDHKREDEEFRALWEQAIDEGTDVIEAEAFRRAVEGVDEPVFYQGEPAGSIRRYSDTLLTVILKGRRANVYNTERHEHTGEGGGPIDVKTEMTVRFVKANHKDD